MTVRRQALRASESLASFFFLPLILVFLLSFNAMPVGADPVVRGAGATEAQSLAPGDMNTGALLLQSEDGKLIEAPRLNTDVAISVNGTIARTIVTQRFENPSDRWLEGIYVFPLPEQSAVDALRMEIGGRVIVGEIKGRDQAKELYEAAKDAGHKASLVEQERPNIFTNSVANIGPKESVVIRIEYQETVKQDGGVYSLRFPLVVAPRYNPEPSNLTLVDVGGKPGQVDPVPDRDRISPPVLDPDKHAKINPVAIQVKLNAGFVLGDIKSAFHEIVITHAGEEAASLTLLKETVPADKDFELTWTPKATGVPQTALFHEIVGGQDFLLAMVTPPSVDSGAPVLPRELIFVIDNSGSMAGTSIMQAKQSLLFALDRLRPGDKFNVIRFDDTMETVFAAPVDATTENLGIAKHFVSRLDAQGGTEMLPALKAALKDTNPGDTSRVRQVVFLTDGSVGNEAQLFAEISTGLGRSRLFTVGIGSAPNSYFMQKSAELGRGTFTHIGSDAQVLERMTALFKKLEKPVMVGLKAEWPDGATVESWPNPLPDLYAGEPVVLSAKVSTLNGDLRLQGTFDGKPWTAALRLSDAIDGAGVAKLWARSKISSLESKAFGSADTAGIDKQIEAIALEHHLVSSQTSLVAIDTLKTRPDGQDVTTTKLPLNLPDGWVYDKVFGSQPKARHAMKTSPRAIGMNSALQQLPYAYGEATAAMRSDQDPSASAAPVAPGPTVDTSKLDVASGPVVVPTESESTAQPDPALSYPVQTLTVVPKPEAGPPLLPQVSRGLDQRTVFMVLLIMLSAVTLIVWRYYRRYHASPRRIEGGSDV